MERELQRVREKEPVIYDPVDGWFERRDEARKNFASLPRVIKFDSIPWSQNLQAYHKVFIRTKGGDFLVGDFRGWSAPIYTMTCLEQILSPGGKSGRHRHYFEALFFILEGKGYEIHDGVKYDWEQGDLVIVPTYTIHQHFNASTTEGARLFYLIPGAFNFMGISDTEQIESHEGFKPREGTQVSRLGLDEHGQKLQDLMYARRAIDTPLASEAQTFYDEYLNVTAEENRWRATMARVVKPAERSWEVTRQGKLRWFVHPRLNTALRTLESFQQELEAGGRSGMHRHVGEEIMLVLEGRGHSVIDGVKWEWEKEDLICVPINSIHQHFNADPRHLALLLSITCRLYSFVGHGGIEQFEDSSIYLQEREKRG